METVKFKTNIKCSGCVAKVAPFLNETVGTDNWQVDTQNPDKLLSIGANESISPENIIKAVKEAGYKAERV
jgi:copper chaperone CopZ